MHRRTFLTAAATSPLFIGPFGGPDGRQDDLERDDAGYPEPPEHITEIRADTDELEQYQPKLYLDYLPWDEQQQTKADMRGVYGWTAESADYDVTAHYFWTRYNTQRSVTWYLGFDLPGEWDDSHYLDHEPTIVFVDDDGEVDEIWTTGGHHYGLRIDGVRGNLSENRVEDTETHVNLSVIRPHNHYRQAPLGEEGSFPQTWGATFDSWLDVRETWYDNGRYGNTSYEAIEDPFSFYDRDRQHWWREDTTDAWFAKNVWIPLGLSRGDDRDRLFYEE